MSRTSNSIKNAKFSMIAQVMNLLINFITRSIFLKLLGVEYLGINGLFSNILSVLSLAELGFGSAIIYSIYKPLANKDTEKIKTFMFLYKKIYMIIGVFIFATGMLLMPFLGIFIKKNEMVQNINIIYFLFLLNTVITYFFSYRRSLLIADQKKYIDVVYQYSSIFITKILQIAFLYATKSYIAFLLIQIIVALIENIVISLRIFRIYPFLKEKRVKSLEKEEKREISKNVKALFFHRLGTVIVNGTDNLLISRYVGIASVGIYSNYVLIISSLKMIYDMIFQSLTASIGNLGATEEKDKVYRVFRKIDFIGFWLYGFSSVALMVLLNPFIGLWLGDDLLFSEAIVAIIVLNFYVRGMRHSVLTFRDALGVFYYDRYKPIFESVINLVFSIALALQFGVVGILLGTLISSITTSTWVEPFVLYKYGFNKNVKEYFELYVKRMLIVVGISIFSLLARELVYSHNLTSFVVLVVLVTAITNVTLFLIYKNKTECQAMIELIKGAFRNS